MAQSLKSCPSCGNDDLAVFFDVPNIPVHSCIMLDTREDALAFPRDDLKLAFCSSCGFVTNAVFDPRHTAYSSVYEDQQSFSPTFNAFAQSLAERLVREEDLRGKRVVEIGCGKGDFLALVCEIGDNAGVGIDPTCVAERLTPEAARRIKVIPDYYSERYSKHVGDMIMCRHTLEHIPDTRAFVDTIRRSIGPQNDTRVFFEIPDGMRVVRDLAFEDIYYEHCSYFSPGSAARLFRAQSFEVTNLELEYGDQYLLLNAVPADAPVTASHAFEEPVSDMEVFVNRFAASIANKLDAWRNDVVRLRQEGRRPVVWGSGSKCVAFLTTIGVEDEIEHVVDINPHRQGKYIPGVGKRVMAPESLPEYDPGAVIVMNSIYVPEIQKTLSKLGLEPEVLAL